MNPYTKQLVRLWATNMDEAIVKSDVWIKENTDIDSFEVVACRDITFEIPK